MIERPISEQQMAMLQRKAAVLASFGNQIKWGADHAKFQTQCPYNEAHTLAVSVLKTKCLGLGNLDGCSQTLIDSFFANGNSNGNGTAHHSNGRGNAKVRPLYARLKDEIKANPERTYNLLLETELIRKSNSRELFARCPFHDDHHPSLRVNLEKATWYCDVCGDGGNAFKLAGKLWPGDFQENLKMLGDLLLPNERGPNLNGNAHQNPKAELPRTTIKTTKYEIRDLDGELKATHVRLDYSDGSKAMPWEPVGTKPTELPLYGIARITDSSDGEAVIVCEGEKAAESLWNRKFLAVGTVTGAGLNKPIPCDESLKPLLRLKIYLWPDNDDIGYDHMEKVGKRLIGLGAQEVLTVKWKEAPPKGDAANYEDDVDSLLAGAEPFAIVSEAADAANAQFNPDVERLAKLPPLEYGKCRKAEAKKMGVPVGTLDGEVEKARKLYQAKHPEPKVAPQWTPMPQSWTEAVHGQELIAELVGAIRRFVMLDESAAQIAALWVLFTWAFEGYAETNPYLRVISAAPGCGKSTLLKVLRWLARSGWLLARISPSSFARTMDKERRTLLLDEGDAFLHENEVMRNLLDGASDPDTATVSLAEKQGDNWQPIELNVFVPIAIASIGALRRMETVEDRSIAIHLKRATGVELKPLDKGRRRTLKAILEPLALKCAKWATDNASALKGARPELPDTMLGREQDKWEPLIGVADVLGSEFGILARKIAVEVSASRGDDGATAGVMLIADLQGGDIFGSEVEFVSTAVILEELHKLEHRPWPAYGRNQKPMSAIQLARLLKPFSIFPASNGTTRGYKHSDLADVFMRHPAHTPSQPVNPSETSRGEGESEFSGPSRTSSLDGSKNRETPWESKAADTLTDKTIVDAEIEAEIDRLTAADTAKDMDDREEF